MVVKTFLVIIVMQITREHQYTGLDSLPSFVRTKLMLTTANEPLDTVKTPGNVYLDADLD